MQHFELEYEKRGGMNLIDSYSILYTIKIANKVTELFLVTS